MDSVSQIVLGAACGEAVLGRKMGNRAMIWGAIGGTLPDMDIIANLFLDPINSLGFHRGPMHSIVFALIVPFVLGPLVKKLYDRNWYSKTTWKIFGFTIGVIFFLLFSFIIISIWKLVFDGFPWVPLGVLIVSGFTFFYYRFQQVFTVAEDIPVVSTKEWILLFFWAIFTHPLLDCLTTYGTVLFWPFSDWRISISSISIVDPLYTIPFAILLLTGALHHRTHPKRNVFTWLGICISSTYLLITFINKQHINSLFEKNLKEAEIPYNDFITVPTIFNNVLWYAIAKQDSGYVYGYYSLFDAEKKFKPLQYIESNHHLLYLYKDQKATNILPWFSDGYYNVFRLNDSIVQYNDLRFGSMSGRLEKRDDFIFKFYLKDNNGILEMEENRTRPKNNREDIDWFKKRIAGVLRPE